MKKHNNTLGWILILLFLQAELNAQDTMNFGGSYTFDKLFKIARGNFIAKPQNPVRAAKFRQFDFQRLQPVGPEVKEAKCLTCVDVYYNERSEVIRIVKPFSNGKFKYRFDIGSKKVDSTTFLFVYLLPSEFNEEEQWIEGFLLSTKSSLYFVGVGAQGDYIFDSVVGLKTIMQLDPELNVKKSVRFRFGEVFAVTDVVYSSGRIKSELLYRLKKMRVCKPEDRFIEIAGLISKHDDLTFWREASINLGAGIRELPLWTLGGEHSYASK